MKKLTFKTTLAAAALAVAALGTSTGDAVAAGAAPKPDFKDWSWNGIFGTYDRAATQRGFQVFKENCASCHGLELVAFRNLAELGFSEEEVKAIAAEYEVEDGPNDEGEMFMRPARPSDRWPNPFPNKKAAAASNNGKAPPDLSLITKSRGKGADSHIRISLKNPTGFPTGADYVYSLLMGYPDVATPESMQKAFDIADANNMAAYELALAAFEAGETTAEPTKPEPVTTWEQVAGEDITFNAYYPGFAIAMGQPIYDDGVEYADGTAATVAQQAYDVTTFLAWAAEPELEQRKQLGIKVMLFLLVLTGMLYAVKRKIWADVH